MNEPALGDVVDRPPDASDALLILSSLPAMNPARFRNILRHHDPADALDRLLRRRPLHPMAVRSIRGDGLVDLAQQAANASLAALRQRCAEHEVEVIPLVDPRYPAVLAADPEAPPVIFIRGDVGALDERRVGVIGTRNATASGMATATDLGRALANEGVSVISGLARGIDGAAHRGVRGGSGVGRPVAVVGNGLDAPYPKRHADLWHWVASAGLLLSEWPPGTSPDAWRFPQRNRILAALCEIVVVVESRERGGSLITARAALDRGVEVMVVPGSPRCRASAGTNQLLRDGAAPVTSVDDVMMMLGLDHRRQGSLNFDPRPRPDPLQARVLAVCDREPSTLDAIVAEVGCTVVEAAMAAARLERMGWLHEAAGWFERAGSRLAGP